MRKKSHGPDLLIHAAMDADQSIVLLAESLDLSYAGSDKSRRADLDKIVSLAMKNGKLLRNASLQLNAAQIISAQTQTD